MTLTLDKVTSPPVAAPLQTLTCTTWPAPSTTLKQYVFELAVPPRTVRSMFLRTVELPSGLCSTTVTPVSASDAPAPDEVHSSCWSWGFETTLTHSAVAAPSTTGRRAAATVRRLSVPSGCRTTPIIEPVTFP